MSAANATGSFTVPFTVSGDSSARTVRVTKTGQGYSVEHQYKASYYVTIPSGFNLTELYYYANDGFDISADTGTNVDGWQDSNEGYHRGGVIRGVSGDITLTEILKGTDFTIATAKPGSANEIGTGSSVYKLVNAVDTDAFQFSATPSNVGESLPTGATYTWTINNGTPVSGSSDRYFRTYFIFWHNQPAARFCYTDKCKMCRNKSGNSYKDLRNKHNAI